MESAYSLDNVLYVFRYFFKAYEDHTGAQHPGIRREQIQDIIQKMPVLREDRGRHGEAVIYLDPDLYPQMIDKYFQTNFLQCNYRINHFFGGSIRLYRYYECYI